MRSVTLRVTLLAAAVLTASLAIALTLAYQLLVDAGSDQLDAALSREQAVFARTVEDVRAQVGQGADQDSVRVAVNRYLGLYPGSEAFYVMIQIDGQTQAPATGPADLTRLASAGQLTVGTPGRFETVDTAEGKVRILTTEVALSGGGSGAIYSVAGSLEAVRSDALSSLRRLATAGAVSLLVGSVLLALALRVTLAPLRAVASAARATGSVELDTSVLEPHGDDEVSVLAREFNRMIGRLSDAADSRRQFLAAVSHELRTPLTIARGHLEIFTTLGESDPDTIARTADVVAGELRHMGRLVDDLMTLAHSDGQGFLELTDVSLPDLFDDLRLRMTGLDLDGIRLQEHPPAITVRADPDRLAQAVLNLVVNAQRHTPPGTMIEVRAHDDGAFTTIAVSDNGPGIDPTIRERMFEPFVTAGGPPADRGGNNSRPAGLGLAVVAAIIDAHHGTIAVETDAGGTRMGLRLPSGLAPNGRETTSRP